MLQLYGFTVSHYAEKARWALDYKRIEHEWIPLLPGPHAFVVRRIAPLTTVPVLRDGDTVVQGSGEILDYVESHYPERSLTPASEDDRRTALGLERRFDRDVGETTRRIFYSHALPNRRLTLWLFKQGGPWWASAFYALSYPVVARVISRMYETTPENVKTDEDRLARLFAEMEERLQGHRYLVGDRFSRADLTLAALLGAMWLPPERPVEPPPDDLYPPGLQEWKRRHADAPLVEYVFRIYRDHRVV